MLSVVFPPSFATLIMASMTKVHVGHDYGLAVVEAVIEIRRWQKITSSAREWLLPLTT